jgi:hypothetical protein
MKSIWKNFQVGPAPASHLCEHLKTHNLKLSIFHVFLASYKPNSDKKHHTATTTAKTGTQNFLQALSKVFEVSVKKFCTRWALLAHLYKVKLDKHTSLVLGHF